MRTTALLAATVSLALVTAATAEPCVYGRNRPAIDVVDRHITPGGTVVVCNQQTVKMVTPSGKVRDEKIWLFQKK